MNNNKKGRFGEKYASQYLLKKGFDIIETNWTCRWGEIDIIARYSGFLIFVEVKYRSSSSFGHGYESISYFKRKSLYRSFNNYLACNSKKDVMWRFDVISILKVPGRLEVQHFEGLDL